MNEPVGIDVAAYREATDPSKRPNYTKSQGEQAFRRHRLGPLEAWSALESGFLNRVYLARGSGRDFIIKIKYRPGFSLEIDRAALEIVRKATDLPVASTAILDTSQEPFGYPYLITERLAGTSAEQHFQTASPHERHLVAARYGEVLGTLHSIDKKRAIDLPQRSYSDWKAILEKNILEDDGLVGALPPQDQDRLGSIAQLLEQIEATPEELPVGFLWGDPSLRNLLIEDFGITGVIDFESAAFGDLAMDQLDAINTLENEVCQHHFWEAYTRRGGRQIQPSATWRRIRHIVQSSRFWWLWQVAGVLSPATSDLIVQLERRLTRLRDEEK